MIESIDLMKNKVCGVDLETLENSITEKYPSGAPVGGIEHFRLISRILDMAKDFALEPEVTDMFIANNRDRYRPGVTLDINLAREFGDTSPKAMMFRRVFCNIIMHTFAGGEQTMCAAVSYSQKGITIGLGAHVHYCRNLCLLGAKYVFTNYGVGINELKDDIKKNTEDLLNDVGTHFELMSAVNDEFNIFMQGAIKNQFTMSNYDEVIGRLMQERVRHDSDNALIHQAEIYPLNSSQINAAAEMLLVQMCQAEKDGKQYTMWDAYNALNYELKPTSCEFPNIIPQSAKLYDIFNQFI